jgi:multimeric flavodoxin WrbA
MKVLLINGSPRDNGNTFTALSEMAKTLNAEGIETEIVSIGKKAVQGCIACGMCSRLGKCTFNDDLYYKIWRVVKDGIDGLVIGSPVYYGGPNGSLCALLDRVFYSLGKQLQYKPGASVVVCRRGGATAAFDRLNKYFTMMNMPLVSSQYWNIVYGQTPGQASLDEEGMQTMRTTARNMAWMMRKFNEGDTTLPEQEQREWTNFIR